MIPRFLQDRISKRIKSNKVIMLYGARRVGKTVLLKELIKDFKGKSLVLNGEDYDAKLLLEEKSISNYRTLLQGIEILVIDEAQNISDIGQKLKLIVDEIPGIKVIASGSSSFDLKNHAGEPLVGRSMTYQLFPFSQEELNAYENILQTRQNLESRLICGSYPEPAFFSSFDEKREYLQEMVNAYLLKDILSIDGLRNSGKMKDLLQLIAFQIGTEVSLDEIGRQLGMSKGTVEKYLDLLSKVFIIFRLKGFSRNLRKEISKGSKWYFVDTGIRNAIIGNFAPLSMRNDTGLLWENYLLSERIKMNNNRGLNKAHYFWRTYDGQEIDLIEVSGDEIHAFECNWGKGTSKIPIAFSKGYPDVPFQVINRDNYLDFILSADIQK
ncbi:MAG: ATP-binding protein [Bacteroidota bacterium]